MLFLVSTECLQDLPQISAFSADPFYVRKQSDLFVVLMMLPLYYLRIVFYIFFDICNIFQHSAFLRHVNIIYIFNIYLWLHVFPKVLPYFSWKCNLAKTFLVLGKLIDSLTTIFLALQISQHLLFSAHTLRASIQNQTLLSGFEKLQFISVSCR